MSISKNLREVLACPKCKGDVEEKGMFIACGKCRLAFPVLDGNVPDMLIPDAWPLAKARKAGFRHSLKL
ncbi:MAG: Trm112 family protein [Candidatus Aenigmarchaeota archaeon]|nr:Trm112 family protein [Candidatus Aenigmarchaeota archaeon]